MNQYRPNGFNVLPPVIKNIIIINVLFVLVGTVLSQYNSWIIDTFALHSIKSPMFKPWQLITHMFMHGNMSFIRDVGGVKLVDDSTLMHIFFNMFSLWVFGSMLERIWGSKRFLNFYILCGLGAAVLHLLVLNYEYSSFVKNAADFMQNQDWAYFNKFVKQIYGDDYGGDENLKSILLNWSESPQSDYYLQQANNFVAYTKTKMLLEPTVGASGAVFGILFAFGYLFPNTLLYIYFMIPLKAKYVVALMVAYELFSGLKHSAGDNIAHFAHLGGMLVAFLILKIWFQKNRTKFY